MTIYRDLSAIWRNSHAWLKPSAPYGRLPCARYEVCPVCHEQTAVNLDVSLRYGASTWVNHTQAAYCLTCEHYTQKLDIGTTTANDAAKKATVPITALDARLWSEFPDSIVVEWRNAGDLTLWYCCDRGIEQQTLSVEAVTEWLDGQPSVRSISLLVPVGGAVPVAYFELARKAQIRALMVFMIFKGTSKLNADEIRHICDSGVDYVSISTDIEYSSVGVIAQFQSDWLRAFEDVAALHRYRDTKQYTHPRIAMRGLLFRQAEQELPAMLEMAQLFGADEFESPLSLDSKLVEVSKEMHMVQLKQGAKVFSSVARDIASVSGILPVVKDRSAEEGVIIGKEDSFAGTRRKSSNAWQYASLSRDSATRVRAAQAQTADGALTPKRASDVLAEQGYQNAGFNLSNGLPPTEMAVPSPEYAAYAASLIKQFCFPLNVYAHALRLEHGQVEWLHYGLFDHPDESILTAQNRSTDMLMARVPKEPKRILEVGVGVGTLLARLGELGHQITGVTRDPAQVQYASLLNVPNATLIASRFEDFAATEPFDMVLFQESSQYIQIADVFKGCAAHVKPGGDLIILDEFVEQPDPAYADHLHVLQDFLAEAERQHFTLVESVALGSKAAPTVDTILGLIDRWEDEIREDLGVDTAQLDTLHVETKAYHDAYASGRYGYRLLHFRREAGPRWRVADETEADAPAMRELFADVFGSEMDQALWQWKYGNNRAAAAGVWDADGRMVAHYGGFRRKVRMFGEPVPALQIGDVMVRTEARGSLSRKGPFFLAASHFLSRQVGYDKPALIAFGFPNDRAMRVAQRQGLYGEMGRMVAMSWPSQGAQLPWLLAIRPFDPSERGWERQVDQLWSEMAAGMRDSIVGERNAAWITQRYLERPGQNYRGIWVYNILTRRPYGLLIVRDAGDGLEWLDLVAPPDVWHVCASAARISADQSGEGSVNLWISTAFAPKMGVGATQHDLGIALPCCTWTPGPSVESQANRWFLVGGDTDFL